MAHTCTHLLQLRVELFQQALLLNQLCIRTLLDFANLQKTWAQYE